MRHLPLLLSLIAVSSLSFGCDTGGNGSTSDDDDTGTEFPNPGPVDVPTSTGPQATLPDLTVDQVMLNESWFIQTVDMGQASKQNEYACAVASFFQF